MRIDVILESNNSPERIAELGRLAEQHGLGGVWVSNMNDARDPFINFVELARTTNRIRLGPIAVSPFELHPLKMASSLLTLNEIAKGRAQIVVGAGGGTATAMNAKMTRRVRAVRECIEVINAAATGKPVRYEGEVFQVRYYNPKWVKSAPPAIYAGANGAQMLGSTARYAAGIMVSDFMIPQVRWARSVVDPVMAEAGRSRDSLRFNNFWAWHIKPTLAAAQAEATMWLSVRGTLYPPYINEVLDPDEAALVTKNIRAFAWAHHQMSPVVDGVPEAIVQKLVERTTSACAIADLDREVERLREFGRAGLNEIALRIYEQPEDTIRLLGERVVPALNG